MDSVACFVLSFFLSSPHGSGEIPLSIFPEEEVIE